MEFSEKQLVDIFWKNHVWDQYPFQCYRGQGLDYSPSTDGKYRRSKSPYHGELVAAREFVLPSGKRVDLAVFNKVTQRCIWLIEFKLVADVDTVFQLRAYRDEVWNHKKTKFKAVAATICAQYFHRHTTLVASQMGFGCIHLAPINYERANTHDLHEVEWRCGEKWWTRALPELAE